VKNDENEEKVFCEPGSRRESEEEESEESEEEESGPDVDFSIIKDPFEDKDEDYLK
jgi:hypothetical protein